jgi:hypothetical protein
MVESCSSKAPGVGKSTLLHAGSALARDHGVTVLSGRGSPLEHQFSYGVVRQLYEPFGLADVAYESDVLQGAAGLSLRAFRKGDGEGVARVSFATLHGLYWLTANVASRAPIVLVVDDSQWADVSTLRFLIFLGSRLDGLRTLVLVARRTWLGSRRSARARTRAGDNRWRTPAARAARSGRDRAPGPARAGGPRQRAVLWRVS